MANILAHGDLILGTGSMQFAKSFDEFPTNPKQYQIIFKGGVLYAYTAIGGTSNFNWLPLGTLPSSYLHTQSVAAAEWVISHNLKSRFAGVFVYDTDGHIQMCQTIVNDENTVTVSFGEALAGIAVIFVADSYTANTISSSAIDIGTLKLTDEEGVLNVNGQPITGGSSSGGTFIGENGYDTPFTMEAGKSYVVSEVNCDTKTINLPADPKVGDRVDFFFDGTHPTPANLMVYVSAQGKMVEGVDQTIDANVPATFYYCVYSGATQGWKVY